MKVKQAHLTHKDNTLITWIPTSVSLGSYIRFKGSDIYWFVQKVYPNVVVDKESLHIDWEVGGLQRRNRKGGRAV